MTLFRTILPKRNVNSGYKKTHLTSKNSIKFNTKLKKKISLLLQVEILMTDCMYTAITKQ